MAVQSWHVVSQDSGSGKNSGSRDKPCSQRVSIDLKEWLQTDTDPMVGNVTTYSEGDAMIDIQERVVNGDEDLPMPAIGPGF